MAKANGGSQSADDAASLAESSGDKTTKARQDKAPLSSSHQLGVAASLKGVNLRATGLYAGAVASGLAFGAVLLWGKPLENPGHFVWSVIMAFICGSFTNAVMSHGRLTDALAEKDNYRREANRVAESRNKLEDKFLAHRLSSEQPPQLPPQPQPPPQPTPQLQPPPKARK